MPQIISKIKDDLQAVLTLACFVGQSLYIYIQQCKDEGGGGGHRLHNNRLDITLLGYKSALVYLYPGIINKYWGIINISKLN